MAEDGLKRLQSDLNAVMEKVQLCREIMLVSPGIDEDETLAGVVGFLEACRDRMGSLIEAGTQGELSEELFERCLSVNDAVCRTLDAERTGTKIAVNEEELGSNGNKKEDGGKPLLELEGDSPKGASVTVPLGKSAASTNMDSNGYTKPSSQEDALLAPYVPPPAPVVQAEVDPWGDSAFSNDLPSPPSVTPTVSEPIPATATEPTDSTSASASAAVPVVGSAQAAAEFDAFFDSLGEKK